MTEGPTTGPVGAVPQGSTTGPAVVTSDVETVGAIGVDQRGSAADKQAGRQGAAYVRFRRLLIYLAITGAAMVAAALLYLDRSGPMTTTLVVTVVLGVFVSILLGGGLMATGFYSSESGTDEDVAAATGPTQENGKDGSLR